MKKFKILSALAGACTLISAPMFITSCNEPTKKECLNDYSWKEIKKISESGKASETFHVGDEKTVMINGLKHQARIIDFNHDKNKQGDTLGITFEFKNLITNPDGTVVGNIWGPSYNYDYFEYSSMEGFLNNEGDYRSIINLFPDDLKEVIKPVYKRVGHTDDQGTNWYAKPTETKLFLLAHDEMTSTNYSYVVPGEDGLHKEGDSEEHFMYAYYKDHDNDEDRKKHLAENEDTLWYDYWLRSPSTMKGLWTGACAAFSVSYGALDNIADINGFENGVAPAFCI